MIAPQVVWWPPSAPAASQRWAHRLLYAVAVQLDATWAGRQGVAGLAGELRAGTQTALDGLESRLRSAANGATVVWDSSELIAVAAGAGLDDVAAAIERALDCRRRAVGVLRDLARLARMGLLDVAGLPGLLEDVIEDLDAAGSRLAAADVALIAALGEESRLSGSGPDVRIGSPDPLSRQRTGR